MLSAAIYARVSTDEQAERGYSLSAQIEHGRRRAEELGADEIVVYADPAESSMTLDRPALTAMRLAIERRRHQLVIVWDQDRLSRDAVGALLLREEILAAGCQLLFLQGGATTHSPDDLLLYGIKALMAQSERIKIRARTMMGRRRKAEMGVMPVKFRLYGYVHDTRSGRVDIDEERAAWVRRLFAWCATERISAWAIARRLSGLGAPSPRGKGWYKETVARLLRNEAYCGTAYVNKFDARNGYRLRPREEWIPIAVPAVVSRELWEAAQATLGENRRRTQRRQTHAALLRGLLRCGGCGKGMRTFISPGSRHRPRYYCNPLARVRPGDPRAPSTACRGLSVRLAAIDPVVWSWAAGFLAEARRVRASWGVEGAEAGDLDGEARSLEAAVARCARTRQGILGFYAAGLVTREEADGQLEKVRRDEAALRRRLDDVRALLAAALRGDEDERVAAVRAALDGGLSTVQRGGILREIVDHIDVWAGQGAAPPRLTIHLRVGP